jgi:hypothetical protein
LNSRIKDFYDIWLLSRQFDFSGENLTEALRLTFERRETQIPDAISAFSEKFVTMKQIQWTAFHRRLRQTRVSKDFSDIVFTARNFIEPLVVALTASKASLTTGQHLALGCDSPKSPQSLPGSAGRGNVSHSTSLPTALDLVPSRLLVVPG